MQRLFEHAVRRKGDPGGKHGDRCQARGFFRAQRRGGSVVPQLHGTVRPYVFEGFRAGQQQQLYPLRLHFQGSGDLSRRGQNFADDGAAPYPRLTLQSPVPLLRAGHQPEQTGVPAAAGSQLRIHVLFRPGEFRVFAAVYAADGGYGQHQRGIHLSGQLQRGSLTCSADC